MIARSSSALCRGWKHSHHRGLRAAQGLESTRRTSSTAAEDSQTLVLPDGRVLGYSEVGCRHGYPLLYFHGFPSSRLEGSGIAHVARQRRLRVLALDRPGFGISTFQPNRRMTDWPRDVRAFAEHLGLTRFAIMGGSGGGPYALACAHHLPREMLSAVGLLSSGGPYDKGVQDVPMASRITHLAAKHWPSGLRAAAASVVGTTKWLLRTGPGSRWFDGFLRDQKQLTGALEPPESRELTPEEEREDTIRTIFEGFAQGPEAFAQEALLLSEHWGFELENIEYTPIQIWHGTHDINAPIAWIRGLAERLPHSQLTEFEGDTHYTISRHLERILTELVPDSVPDKT